MKTTLTIVLLILTLSLKGQEGKYKFKVKEHIAPAAMMFVAGMADGINQGLMFRYEGFKKVFPGANDKYWQPSQSWKNKYENGDPAQGPKFPGSTTWLVFVTDGYHLSRFTTHLFTSGAIAVKIGQKKRKWYVYVIEGLSYWAIQRMGFALSYYRF